MGTALTLTEGQRNLLSYTSEDEVVRLFGAGAGSNVNSPKGTWWMEHPVNRVRPSGNRSHNERG